MTCLCACVCVLVNSSLATKVSIGKYLAARRVVVSVSGGEWIGKATINFTSLLHAP